MSNTTEKADLDEQWLYERAEKMGKTPTLEQIEAFTAKVSRMEIDDRVPEHDARRMALAEVMA